MQNANYFTKAHYLHLSIFFVNKYRDNNKGLVKQVVKALHRKNILKLTNTFLSMSISDLAQRINLPNTVEAEEHLMTMVFKTRKILN